MSSDFEFIEPVRTPQDEAYLAEAKAWDEDLRRLVGRRFVFRPPLVRVAHGDRVTIALDERTGTARIVQ
jgi:hypothetical protein